MSYILDALRRADAEREREGGAVPTLHAQAHTMPEIVDDEPGPRRPAWLLPVVALGAVLALAFAWWSMRATAPQVGAVEPSVEPVRSQASGVVGRPLHPTLAMETQPLVASSLPVPPTARPAAAPALPAPPVESKAAPAAKVPRFNELPDTLRREIPALAIGGSIFSSERAARMLIVNGQVHREGEAVAKGLVIDEIRAKSAIFTFKGQRFELML